jgi:hypothetical protein
MEWDRWSKESKSFLKRCGKEVPIMLFLNMCHEAESQVFKWMIDKIATSENGYMYV